MRTPLKNRVVLGVVLAALVFAATHSIRAELPQTIGTWASLGTTPESRVAAAAVALTDGRTLIAGGSIDGTPTHSVAVFDPNTGSFSLVGHLLLARVGHTATLLDDGRILIAGGTAGDLMSADLELFDPVAGVSVLGGAMAQPRTGHAAAKLANGKVLIVGGTSGDGVLQSAELYDPETGTTTPTVLPMLSPRSGASATTLIDGRVLVAGGNNGTADLATAEIFEPSSQIFEATTTALSFARSGHAAVLLPNNNSVLIAGGSSNGAPVRTTDLFVPAEFPDPYSYGMGSFAQTGDLLTARARAIASPHIEGYAVAMGGGAPEAEVYRFPTIKTDNDDYAPGTRAVITGSGWEPNAEVTLVFQEDPAVHDDYVLHVTADDNGNLYWDQWAPEPHDLNVRFYLMAKQPTPSGERRAQTTFTDSIGIGKIPTVGVQTPSPVPAGGSATYSVTVSFTGSGANCTAVLSASGLPAGASASFAPVPSGNPANTITTSGSDVTTTLTVFTTAGTTPVNLSGTQFTIAAAGGTCSGSASTNPTGTGGNAPNPVLKVDKANQTITFAALGNKTYGDADFSVSATASSGLAVSFSSQTLLVCTMSGSTVHIVAQGSCTIRASQAGNPSYNAAPNVDQSFTINKANATVVVTPYSVTYNGSAHTATYTISGVNGESDATVGTVSLNTTHTNAGTYSSDSWSFTGAANYNDIASTPITDTIHKVNATVVVTPYTVDYDGNPHTATDTISGVNGESDATVGTVTLDTTHTNAGTYSSDTWSFTGGTNYNDIASTTITDTIHKVNATVVVTPYTVDYDGNPHTATDTISGVNGESGATVGTVTLDTTHTNAGTYSSDTWSFTGGTNYNDIASTTITDTIHKVNATVVVTPYTVDYDGNPHTATDTISGVNGESGATVGTVTLDTTHTNAGTYSSDTWSFTGGTNYNDIASTTITDTIHKVNATVVVTPYTVDYDGNPHTATDTISGVNGESGATVGTVTLDTTHTNAGTYSSDSWSFTGAANYNDIASTTITDTIHKVNATVVVTPYTVDYDGNPHTATDTISGVNGESGATVGTVSLNTTHTNAGTYSSDSWSFTGAANYNDIASTTITDTIHKVNATVVVTPYTVDYDGNPHTATDTISGVNGESGATVGTVTLDTTHTNAGTYSSDTWSFTGGTNYNDIASTTITDTIHKVNATVVVTPYTVDYDGNPHTATDTISGVNGESGATVGTVSLNTTHTNAGTYSSDSWSFTGAANYNDIASTTITDTIHKVNATVVVTPYTVDYDGNPHTATDTISGVNGESDATVGTVSLNTTHTNAGTYSSDSWSFTGAANYNDIASTTITDTIHKVNATVVVTPYTVDYDGNPHTATDTISGVNGESGATVGTVTLDTTHTNAGTYSSDTWSFTGGTNYNDIASTTITDTIHKVNATVVVTPYTVDYDGNPHTATDTISGVNGESGATVGTVTLDTTHTNAGTYSSDTWSFTGGTNYNDIASTTITDTIHKVNATVVVTPYTVDYDGNPHTATDTISGVNGESDATVGTVSLNTTHTNAGTYSSDSWSFTGATNYNDIASTTITDVIDKAPSTTTTVGDGPFVYDGTTHSGGSGTVTGAAGLNTSATSLTYTGDQVNAGTYYVTAHYAGDANHFGSDGAAIAIIIDKAPSTTTTVGAGPFVYDGTTHSGGSGTVTGAGGLNTSATSLTYTGDQVNAGTYYVTAHYAGDANHFGSDGAAIAIIIDKAPSTTTTVGAGPFVYDGTTHSGGSGTVTGAGGLNTSATSLTYTGDRVNAGTYYVTAHYAGDANHFGSDGAAVGIIINKANALVVVMPYNVPFDGNPHTATVTSITGVNGETGPTVGTVNPSGTTHTPPGSYNGDLWSFTGTANYNNTNGAVNDLIGYGTCSASVGPGGVILAPINSDGTSVYSRKGGSTIPVKFRVCDAAGNPILNSTAVFGTSSGSITMVSAVRGTVDGVNETAVAEIPDVAFRLSGNQWIFNMATSNLDAGTTYTFQINLRVGSIQFRVGVK